MAIDRKHIGQESEDRFLTIDKAQLVLFAQAAGETNPVYLDEERAQEAGYPAIPVPPTFAFSIALLAPAKIGNVADIITNLGGLLHGEQDFQYHRQIFSGDRVRVKTKTVDIFDKKGGQMEFVVQDTNIYNQHDELCVTGRMTLVVRN
jgi:acyl dehydratase